MSGNTSTSRPDLIAYTVKENGERSYFNRIGAGWKNSKGGVKIVLEAVPLSGELLLLPPKERR